MLIGTGVVGYYELCILMMIRPLVLVIAFLLRQATGDMLANMMRDWKVDLGKEEARTVFKIDHVYCVLGCLRFWYGSSVAFIVGLERGCCLWPIE